MNLTNKSPRIIGLSGFIGSGKDTVGDILSADFGYTKISFSDKLKDVLSLLFSWDRNLLDGKTPESREWREQVDEWWSEELGFEITPRKAMQEVGTDVFRNVFSKDIWVKALKKEIVNNPDKKYVITDTRFFNERKFITKDMKGQCWRIKRGPDPSWYHDAIHDNNFGTNKMEKYPDIHKSEWDWIDYDYAFDKHILNDGGLEDLKSEVRKALFG